MSKGRSAVAWIVFDLGETLVDETRLWGEWADYLGIPRLTFFAVLGAVIAAGRPHTDVFGAFCEPFDLAVESRRKAETGLPWTITDADLYPDALAALRRLREAGYHLAIMANQPLEVDPYLASLPVDLCATSAQWGVAKPDPRFFERVAAAVDCAPARIAYVGDRMDNDIVPARAAGMVAVHIRRGPWGFIHTDPNGAFPAGTAQRSVSSLDELPEALRES